MLIIGCLLLASLIGDEDAADTSLAQAGLGIVLEVLRSLQGTSLSVCKSHSNLHGQDEQAQQTVARCLPGLFEQEAACVACANSGVIGHVVALIDLCPSQLELRTSLAIMDRITRWPTALAGYAIA